MTRDNASDNWGGELSSRRLLDALPLPALIVDAARRVAIANTAARALLGHTLEDRDLVFALRDPQVLASVDRALAGERNDACEWQHAGPGRRIFQVQAQPLFDSDGETTAAIVTFSDITLAREAERVRSAFVSNVSHELRSPLSTLISAIETLATTARNDPQARARFLDLMATEAQRMRRLVDDLLSLSRLETLEHIPPRDPVELGPLLDDVARALAKRAQARDMTIDVRVPDDLTPVAADRDELIEVFDNLIDNAIKYGEAGTTITVAAQTEGRSAELGRAGVRLTVHNLGRPIPPEHLPRLTERFYRVDKSRSRELGGTGLGLAIVKHIVNRHRGRLILESSADLGTRITVLLPVQPA